MDEPQSIWDALAARYRSTPDDPDLEWDLEGPKKEKPLQFRIAIGKFVNHKSVYAHKQELKQSYIVGKNVGEEDLAKWRDRAMARHDEMGVAGSKAVDFQDIGRQMARESAASTTSFAADCQKFGSDLKGALLPDEEEEFAEDEASDAEAQEGEENGGGNNKEQMELEAPAVWFERDSKISKANRLALE